MFIIIALHLYLEWQVSLNYDVNRLNFIKNADMVVINLNTDCTEIHKKNHITFAVLLFSASEHVSSSCERSS